jgi:hypothetical protein
VITEGAGLITCNPRRGSQGERSVKADAAGIAMRRSVDAWMARETIAD